MKDEPAAAVLSVAADHVQAGLRWAQLEFSSFGIENVSLIFSPGLALMQAA